MDESVLKRLNFWKERFEVCFRSPLSNFEPEVQVIEYRIDPLTGMSCRLNLKRAERAKQASKRMNYAKEIIERSKSDCPFCPSNLEKLTPCFSDPPVNSERLRVGSSVLFPNLYPFSKYHSVAIFSEDHYPRLDHFKLKDIENCINVCLEYMKSIYYYKTSFRYGSINWNYMPPAGSSIIHPHLQVVVDRSPTPMQEKLIRCSEEYHRKKGYSYWLDLIDMEVELGERLIHREDEITWLASYAPQGNNEILGILPNISSFMDLKASDIETLTKGISNILKGYYYLGVESFNMCFFSGPLGHKLDNYSLNLKMSSRPPLDTFYTADCGFMEKFHLENIIETKPEGISNKFKKLFNNL